MVEPELPTGARPAQGRIWNIANGETRRRCYRICWPPIFLAGPELPPEVLAVCPQVWYSTGRKISGIATLISTVPDLSNSPV
jgi:hypothetical protein